MQRRSPQTPRYEGRPYARPHEELVDQGLAFDLVTMSRRQMLGFFGAGAGVLALAACSTGSTDSTSGTTGSTSNSTSGSTSGSGTASGEIPDETAGPYPGDGSNGPNVLSGNGVVRSDIRSSFGTSTTTAEGIPMTLTLSLVDMANSNAPFAGVAVYVWHCNRAGAYSLYSSGVENENYLRGVQIADDSGQVSFTSVFPACYSGRWPHIHFEVYPDQASIADPGNAIATSQVALPQAVCEAVYATSGYEASVGNLSRLSLATDNVFGDDSAALQLATVTGDTSAGYQVKLTAAVDTRTTPTSGAAPGGGGPGGDGNPPGSRPSSA